MVDLDECIEGEDVVKKKSMFLYKFGSSKSFVRGGTVMKAGLASTPRGEFILDKKDTGAIRLPQPVRPDDDC
jgi:hypothetical protein